jgi:hypothetical protein
MGVGPIVAAVGLALLARLDSDPDYLVDVLPSMLLFGLGLAMTVAPLTTTVLDSVEERHVGVASGVNNAVSRVAGLLAIAALGAVVSAQFAGSLDEAVGERAIGPEARTAIEDAKSQPLSGGDVSGVPEPEAAALGAEIVASSESAFQLGMLIGAALMVLGGAITLVLVRNPERPAEREPQPGPGPAATAGECGRPSEQFEPSPVPGTL